MKFNYVMNCYIFIEIFEFFKWSVEMLWNLHNSLDAFICEHLLVWETTIKHPALNVYQKMSATICQ